MLLNIRTAGLSLKHICTSGLTRLRLRLRGDSVAGVLYVVRSLPGAAQHPKAPLTLTPVCSLFMEKRTMEEFEFSAIICASISL